MHFASVKTEGIPSVYIIIFTSFCISLLLGIRLPRYSKRSQVVFTIVGTVGALGLCFSIYSYWTVLSIRHAISVVEKKFQCSTASSKAVRYPFIPRPSLEKSLAELMSVSSDHTALVGGPRGAGKSTAVCRALRDRQCVVTIPFFTTFEAAVDTFIRKLIALPDRSSSQQIFTAALERLRASGKKVTVVFECDSQCTPRHLQDLLLEAKRMGYEDELAHIVVVISQSRICSYLSISFAALRCKYMTVGNLTEAEARDFLAKVFEHLRTSETSNGLGDEEVGELVELSFKEVGSRLLFLRELQDVLVGLPAKMEVIKDAIKSYSLKKDVMAQNAMRWLFSNAKLDQKQELKFCETLLESAQTCYTVHDLSKKVGVPVNVLLRGDTGHVFYIDPESEVVSPAAPFFVRGLQKYKDSPN